MNTLGITTRQGRILSDSEVRRQIVRALQHLGAGLQERRAVAASYPEHPRFQGKRGYLIEAIRRDTRDDYMAGHFGEECYRSPTHERRAA